ncbi:MAG: hypothetical protein WKF41_18285 [Gaiellaceae bacterium]
MPQGTTWYRRLADIPSIGYAGDDALRARLPERDATPQVHRYEFEGKRTTSLSWSTPEGGTTASPAHRLGFSPSSEHASVRVRADVLAAIELPGEPADYHFAMQSAAELLWKRRRGEPEHLAFVEWLSWLDVRLVEAHPEAFRSDPKRDEYFRILAFRRLVDLYETEGFLRDALLAAERFARFQPSVDVAGLRARVGRLNAEDG